MFYFILEQLSVFPNCPHVYHSDSERHCATSSRRAKTKKSSKSAAKMTELENGVARTRISSRERGIQVSRGEISSVAVVYGVWLKDFFFNFEEGNSSKKLLK